MRSILLSGAAFAGAVALASSPTLAQDLPPTYSQGVPSRPLPVQGANDSNNYQAASLPGGVANPVPGSIVVRFNGRVLSYVFDQGNSLDRTGNLGANSGTPAKLASYGLLGYVRVYTGVDGLAANGLKYGAAVEVRTDEGPTPASNSSDGASAGSRSNTLYIRRAFAYFGRDNIGIIRIGQTDGVNGIFDNGVTTFQNFDNAAWNGDLPGALPVNAQIQFPFFSQNGAEYDPAKIVYLSPQFAGFDFAAQFTPSTSVLQSDANVNITALGTSAVTNTAGVLTPSAGYASLNGGLCSTAESGCPNLASSSAATDGARFKNQYVAGVRYQNKIGDLAVYGYGSYMGSGHVNYTGTSAFQQYNGLGVYDGGVALTYAGFTVGGHILAGKVNGDEALQPSGGVAALAWLGGVQYAAGPLTIGAAYYQYNSQGSPSLVHLSQRHETALDTGLTYSIAPGFSLFGEYMYGTRHQGGVNFQTGGAATAATINTAAAHQYNDIQSQVVGLGTIVKW